VIARRLSNLRSVLSTIAETPSGLAGIALTTSFILVAMTAPYIARYPPTAVTGPPFSAPSAMHPLGTDDIGEDILSQLIFSIRGSVGIAFLAGLISTLVGVTIGLFAGYYGGLLDEVLMRFTDAVLAIPILVLLLTVAAYVPPSRLTVIALIGLLSWPWTARVIRSQTISLRNRPFINSSLMSGLSDLEIIFKAILPNELPLVVLYGILSAVTAMVLEASFDLVGVGSFNSPSLGIMLYFAFNNNALLRGSWWWFLPPGLVIGLFGTGLLLLGYNLERLNRTRL
jgi:peptide/nickel transport system permease protein